MVNITKHIHLFLPNNKSNILKYLTGKKYIFIFRGIFKHTGKCDSMHYIYIRNIILNNRRRPVDDDSLNYGSLSRSHIIRNFSN